MARSNKGWLITRAFKAVKKKVNQVIEAFSYEPETPPVMFSKGLGFDEDDLGYGSDPMVIYRPGTGKRIDANRAMSAYSGWVAACIRAIADEVSNVRFRLFSITKEGNHEEQHEHELLDLLDGVNEYQTGPELKHMIASHLELTGNAYLLLQGVKNDKSKPAAIFALPPANVKILLDKTVFPFKVKGYEFRQDGKKFNYQPYEIVHLKYPDPNNPYDGIGTVQQIPMWIDADNYAMEFNRNFFIHGARIGGFLETNYSDESQLRLLTTMFEENHAGVNNAHRPIALPKGVKFKEGQTSTKDMDFEKMMEMMRDRILAAFRVSRTILGTAESDTNRATAETADYVFAKRTIKPKMQLIVSYLNEFLVPRYGDNIYLSFEDPTPEDKNFKIEELKTVTAGQPVMSINEAREQYVGLGSVKNGENVMIPSTMTVLGSPDKPAAGSPKKSKIKSLDGQTKGIRPVTTQYARNAKVRAKMSDELSERIAAKLAEIQGKHLHEMNDEEYAVVWKRFVERVEPYEKKLTEAVRKFNTEQRAEVKKNLKKIKKAVNPNDIFDVTKWMNIMVDLTGPVLTELAGNEGKAAADALGFPNINILAKPEAKRSLDQSISLLAQSYNETTRQALKDALDEGLSEGAGINKLTDLVDSVYDISDKSRAEAVASTEAFRIANDSTKEAWKQTGVVKTIKWYTAQDAEVCPFCLAQNGKVISIDDNFYNQGDSITADDQTMTLDYSDVGAPPLHPRCRCYTRPEDVSLE